MTSQTERRTRTNHRLSTRSGGAGRFVAPLLLALTLIFAGPASAHHDIEEQAALHPGTAEPRLRDREVDHGYAGEFRHAEAHQHTYTHTHWHTHVLDDGTIVHHKHPHSHTYWHYGPDETEEERVTRVLKNQEEASPHEEGERPSGGTRFVKPGSTAHGPR